MVTINWSLGKIPPCKWMSRCVAYSISPASWSSAKLNEVCSSLVGIYKRCQVWPSQIGQKLVITDSMGPLMTYVQVSRFPSPSPSNGTWVTITDDQFVSVIIDNIAGVGVCAGPFWHDAKPDFVTYIEFEACRTKSKYPIILSSYSKPQGETAINLVDLIHQVKSGDLDYPQSELITLPFYISFKKGVRTVTGVEVSPLLTRI